MKQVKCSLRGIDILDTWREDLDELKEKRNELSRYIRKVEAERKKQPALMMQSPLDDKYYIVNRWHIRGEKTLIAESKREATPDEIVYIEEKED